MYRAYLGSTYRTYHVDFSFGVKTNHKDYFVEHKTKFARDFYSTTNRTDEHEYLEHHAECAENAEFTPPPPSLRLSSP